LTKYPYLQYTYSVCPQVTKQKPKIGSTVFCLDFHLVGWLFF
jgi:hypothetical protein